MPVFDIHIHTKPFSDCSFIFPEDLIKHAAGIGLDGIALTEHGMRWPNGKFAELEELAHAHNLVLINGQEIYTENVDKKMEGEFLVFGMRKSLTGIYTAKELVEIVHAENGILIAAHPFRLSRKGSSYYYGAGDRVRDLQLDALELYHPDHDDRALKKVRAAMHKTGFPGTGGSDSHKLSDVGTFVTVFENDIRNEEDFMREIRMGRIRAEKRK